MNQSTCLSITHFVIKFYVISWAVYESNQILNHLFIIYIFYNIFTYVIYYFYFLLFNINILSYLRSTGTALSTHLLIHLSTNLIIPDFIFLSFISNINHWIHLFIFCICILIFKFSIYISIQLVIYEPTNLFYYFNRLSFKIGI